jgi:aldehyde dehydrogenase (NAD+)
MMSEEWWLTSFDRNEEQITEVYAATEEDVNTAVKAAKAAFKSKEWRDMPGTERGDLLFKLADLIKSERETLATIETWDNGALLGGFC